MLPDSNTIKWSTNCPDSTWIEDRTRNNGAAASAKDLPILFEPNHNQRTPLSIFCGCNKGMDAVNTLRMLSLNPKIDKEVWLDAFRIIDGSACQQHLTPQFPIPPQQQQQQQTPRPAIVYCIEAMPSTFTVLNRTVKQLEWQDSLKVHHAAIADSDGETLFPNAMVGTEHLGMDACSNKRWRKECESVPQYKLDTFVQKFVNATDPIIDILSVDVEGFDWPVLLGATKTLQSTKYLEFEYHKVGAWKQYNLSTAILSLHQQGFVCYWAGRGGKLWRITDCWMDYYDVAKQWSNVACVNLALAPTLAMRMEGVFLKTLDHRTSAAAN
jgi:FkbM family methyltransferase